MKFLRELMFLIAITFSINANSSPLTDENFNEFLVMYGNDYSTQSLRLVNGFKKYKESSDYKGFIQFKNKEWYPKYAVDRDIYDNILETNRKYLFDNGLTWLFSQFTELPIRSNGLLNSLKQKDKALRKADVDKLINSLKKVDALFKERGIEFRPVIKK